MYSHEVLALAQSLSNLTPSQRAWVGGVTRQFQLSATFERNPQSDLITEPILHSLGDALRIHHAFSRQALSKDRFEHALEKVMVLNGVDAALATSRTNRGHDITVNGYRISLKTEAAANTRESHLNISKFMELGRGAWELPLLRDLFLEHMLGYDRVLQFRCLPSPAGFHSYELVEIPKLILMQGKDAQLTISEDSRQNPKPGYGNVFDPTSGALMFQLYFDGGTERKLSIKRIDRRYCVLHGTWKFGSAPLE
ncbi:hypothetical protein [Acidovorax sp.]|uniref:hypothetical protein n=1 Tax=Acidovorax sp. TaxID=1872122 RepID=UPI00391FA7AC